MAATQPRSSSQSSGLVGRRDRPWLLPSNRKLRNLISISLRNVSLQQTSSGRPRGKTIDDDAVPNALKSPAKLVALREQKRLSHSRSSTDLKQAGDDAAVTESDTEIRGRGSPMKKRALEDAVQKTPPRPILGRTRRRSTLEWANASPQTRQEKLERVTKERMADVFYSLHVDGVQGPIYISETVERTMNPTFRHIDFSACGPGITRLDCVTVRFWAHNIKTGHSWRQLLEMTLNLRSLQYLGKHLEDFHHQLPENAVIFQMTDGVYTVFTTLSDYAPPPIAPPSKALNSNRSLPTASFDALLRLAKLDDSIQDALATRNGLAADLERLLEDNKVALTQRDTVAESDDRLKTIEFAQRTVQKQLDKAKRQQQEKQRSLDLRRSLMAQDVAQRSKCELRAPANGVEPSLVRNDHLLRETLITGQRRRICEDLQRCYPIEPIPKKSLAFTICNLYLPNSEDLDSEPPDTVAAALGHVSQVVQLLSFYLSQPLPYPVNPRSSHTTIEDPISQLKTNASNTQRYSDELVLRTYPLFSKNVPRFRFEYAVFLLNKDIQILLENSFGLRVLDIRQTLPNLKYLLYVATAGEGELPARKAGGVRGLMRPDAGRSNSNDSTSSALSGLLWHTNSAEAANGKLKPGTAVDSLRKSINALEKGRAKAGG